MRNSAFVLYIWLLSLSTLGVESKLVRKRHLDRLPSELPYIDAAEDMIDETEYENMMMYMCMSMDYSTYPSNKAKPSKKAKAKAKGHAKKKASPGKKEPAKKGGGSAKKGAVVKGAAKGNGIQLRRRRRKDGGERKKGTKLGRKALYKIALEGIP